MLTSKFNSYSSHFTEPMVMMLSGDVGWVVDNSLFNGDQQHANSVVTSINHTSRL